MVVDRDLFLKKGADVLHKNPFQTAVEEVPELLLLFGLYTVMLMQAPEEENDGHFN